MSSPNSEPRRTTGVALAVLAAASAIAATGAGALGCDGDDRREEVAVIGTEFTTETPILDANGLVVARGWARRPLFRFVRDAIPAARADRIREWDFYAIHTRSFAVMVTLAEVRFEGRGHFALGSVTLHDFATGAQHGGTIIVPDDGDVIDFAPTAGGNYRLDGGGGFIAYEGGPAARAIRFELDKIVGEGGGRISGRIDIAVPDDESIAVVTPWDADGLFFYENKVMALPVTGSISVSGGDADHVWTVPSDGPEADAAFAEMDWVRAATPAVIDWTWAVGGGVVDGKRVGLNFGSVFGDERGGTPDAVLVDGRLHKLPPVAWAADSAADEASGAWHLKSEDGRVDVRLVPNGYRESQDLDLGFYKTRLDKPYGTWSGSVVLDGGERLVVDGLVGAAERVHTEW